MKILVNTRLLIKNKLDGIGWFSYETLSRMAKNHPEVDFIFVFDRPFSKEFVFENNVTATYIGPPARHPFLWWWWFQNSLPRLINRYKPDAILSPDGFLTANTSIPQLAVIHDINFEHYPKDLPFFYRNYYRKNFPKFAHLAKRVATVSEFSKFDIVRKYGVNPEKIDVIYNGANELYQSISKADQIAFKEQKTEGKDFFLFIGNFHPRKNIARMLEAFDAYKKETDLSDKLVMVGTKMWWDQKMEGAYDAMQFKKDVILPGRLSPEDLKTTIGSAKAMLYLSYFEGFGIPVLEGMKAQIPVIGSNHSSIPEVGGKGIIYADPFSPFDIKEKMKELHFNPEWAAEIAKVGFERSKIFSWDKTAEALWQSLIKMLDAKD